MKITSRKVDILHNFLFYTLHQIGYVMLIQSNFEMENFYVKGKTTVYKYYQENWGYDRQFSFYNLESEKKNISIVSELRYVSLE